MVFVHSLTSQHKIISKTLKKRFFKSGAPKACVPYFKLFLQRLWRHKQLAAADQRRVPGDEGGGELRHGEPRPARAHLPHRVPGLSEREVRAAVLPFRARQQRFAVQIWQFMWQNFFLLLIFGCLSLVSTVITAVNFFFNFWVFC